MSTRIGSLKLNPNTRCEGQEHIKNEPDPIVERLNRIDAAIKNLQEVLIDAGIAKVVKHADA